MPVTFFSKPEALEYVRRKREEGRLSKLEYLGRNEYRVILLGTVSEYESGASGLYRDSGEIELPPHTNTRTKLHELGHKEYAHKSGMMKIGKLAKHEIEAEAYAYEKMGKPITYRVAIPAFVTLTEDWKETDEEAIDIIDEELRKKGIQFTEEEKRKLKYFMDRD